MKPRKNRIGDQIETETLDLGRCVCGLRICAVTGDVCAIIHEVPTCAKFDAMAPDDFVAWVRETREAKILNEQPEN